MTSDEPQYRVHPEEPRVLTDAKYKMLGSFDDPEMTKRVAALLNAGDGDVRVELAAAKERLHHYRHRMEMTPSERQSYLGEGAEESAQPERYFLMKAAPLKTFVDTIHNAVASQVLGASADEVLAQVQAAVKDLNAADTSLLL